MAVILNLETASTNCSVSLARSGKVIALKEENSASFSHSEQLHPFIEAVLSDAGLTYSHLEAIAVSKGPGSYTGLRIGVSAAKGLCYALDLPLISISTLKSLAMQLRVEAGVLIPMLDARRMEVYSAVYSPEFKELRETRAEIIEAGSFSEYLNKGLVHLLGSGAGKCRDLLKHPNFKWYENLMPSATEMAMLSYDKYEVGTFEDTAYFEPYYLKEFMLKKKSTG